MGYNPSKDQTAHKSVSFLRWAEALEFCKKVEELNLTIIPGGYELHFPFEAQWEYACQAGNTGAYGTGGESKEKKSCGGRSAARSSWPMNDSRHPMTDFRICLRKTDAITLPGL